MEQEFEKNRVARDAEDFKYDVQKDFEPVMEHARTC
jgi:hypothetical protein